MKDIVKIQFKILADKMDKREAAFMALEEFVKRNNLEVPKNYEADWETWTRIERRRSWRTRPLIVATIRKAARKAAKAARLKK